MWYVLQFAIVLMFVWLTDDAKLATAAVVWGVAFAFLATWVLGGVLDWLRRRPTERGYAPRQGQSLRRIESASWHRSNNPQLPYRRRIGQNIRELT